MPNHSTHFEYIFALRRKGSFPYGNFSWRQERKKKKKREREREREREKKRKESQSCLKARASNDWAFRTNTSKIFAT